MVGRGQEGEWAQLWMSHMMGTSVEPEELCISIVVLVTRIYVWDKIA